MRRVTFFLQKAARLSAGRESLVLLFTTVFCLAMVTTYWFGQADSLSMLKFWGYLSSLLQVFFFLGTLKAVLWP